MSNIHISAAYWYTCKFAQAPRSETHVSKQFISVAGYKYKSSEKLIHDKAITVVSLMQSQVISLDFMNSRVEYTLTHPASMLCKTDYISVLTIFLAILYPGIVEYLLAT